MKKQIITFLCAAFAAINLFAQNYPPTAVSVLSDPTAATVSWKAPGISGTYKYTNDSVKLSYGFLNYGIVNYGIYYTKDQLKAYGLVGRKIDTISVYFRFAAGEARVQIWEGNDLTGLEAAGSTITTIRNVKVGWNRVLLANSYKVTGTKNIVIGASVSNYDSTTYPVTYDKGPYYENGHVVELGNGVWKSLAADFGGNVLVKFTAFDSLVTATTPTAPTGYDILRSQVNSTTSFQTIATNQAGYNYVDNDWNSLPAGVYTYGVVAKYLSGKSDTIISLPINNKTQFQVEFVVTDELGLPLPGTAVALYNTDGLKSHEFRKTTDTAGRLKIPYTWYGNNIYFLEKNGYKQTTPVTINLTQNETINITMSANYMYPPKKVKATLNQLNVASVVANVLPTPDHAMSYYKKEYTAQTFQFTSKTADSTSWGIGLSKDTLINKGFMNDSICSVYLQVMYPGQPYAIKIWNSRENPQVLYRQEVTFATTGWKEVLLDKPFKITDQTDYIVVGATTRSDSATMIYPAVADAQDPLTLPEDARLMYDETTDSFYSNEIGAFMISVYSKGAEFANTSRYTIARRLEAGGGETILSSIQKDTTYVDDMSGLSNGRYVYYVKAVYSTSKSSDSTVSNTVGKGMQYAVTYNIKSTSGNPVKDAKVTLISGVNHYDAMTNTAGVAAFSSVLSDAYTLHIEKYGYVTYDETKNITGVTNENITIGQDKFVVTFNLEFDTTVVLARKPTVTLKVSNNNGFYFAKQFSASLSITCDTMAGGPLKVELSTGRDTAIFSTYVVDINIASDSIIELYYPSKNSLSVKKANGNIDVKVYPNPTTAKLNIETKNIKDIIVYNLMGQAVKVNVSKENDFAEVDFMGLKGIYFVEIRTTQGRSIQRVIVQ